MESGIWQAYKDKEVQVLGLDMWNGSQTQLTSFRTVTRVTFPLLLKAASGTDFGVRSTGSIDAMIVVDQKGVVRQFGNAATSSVNAASALISTLVQGDRPRVALNVSSLDFADVEVDRQARQTLTIRNDGEGTLKVSGVTSDLDGLTVDRTVFDVPADGSVDLTVKVTPGAEGSFSGSLQITSNDPDRSLLTIPLQGTAVVIKADPRTDFNLDGTVNFTDFLQFLRGFNDNDVAFDLNGNGAVEFGDFLVFLKSHDRPLP